MMYNNGRGVEIGFDSTNASHTVYSYNSAIVDYDVRILCGGTSGTKALNFLWNCNSIGTQAHVKSNFVSTIGGTYTGPISCNGLTSNNYISCTSLTSTGSLTCDGLPSNIAKSVQNQILPPSGNIMHNGSEK